MRHARWCGDLKYAVQILGRACFLLTGDVARAHYGCPRGWGGSVDWRVGARQICQFFGSQAGLSGSWGTYHAFFLFFAQAASDLEDTGSP